MKIISTDFDGTLFDENSIPTIPPEVFDFLAFFQKNNFYWVINTGRSVEYLQDDMAKFPILPNFLITRERDIWTYQSEKKIFSPHIEWNEKSDQIHDQLFSRASSYLDPVREFVLNQTAARWIENEFSEHYAIIGKSDEDIFKVRPIIDKICQQIPELTYQSTGPYLRFCHADYSKGSALLELCRLFSISPNETWVIGDGHNDLQAMKKTISHHVACPANATQEIKNHVLKMKGFVSSKSFGFGVCDWFEQIKSQETIEPFSSF